MPKRDFLIFFFLLICFACNKQLVEEYIRSDDNILLDTIRHHKEKENIKDSVENVVKKDITLPGFANQTPMISGKYHELEDDISVDGEDNCVDSLILGSWSAESIVSVLILNDSVVGIDSVNTDRVLFLLELDVQNYTLQYEFNADAIFMSGFWNYYGGSLELVYHTDRGWSETYIWGIDSLSNQELKLRYERPYMVGDTLPREIVLIDMVNDYKRL